MRRATCMAPHKCCAGPPRMGPFLQSNAIHPSPHTPTCLPAPSASLNGEVEGIVPPSLRPRNKELQSGPIKSRERPITDG